MKAVVQIKVIPVIDAAVRQLCCKPYPNHPKGCPNHGCRPTCPPEARLWFDVVCRVDFATWLFWTRFDIAAHRERMKLKHPQWSRRQLDCCLYWQNTARKPLRDYFKVYWQMPNFFWTMCPEAMGVNVTQTMHEIGVELEWPPEKWAYQIAMGGWLRKKVKCTSNSREN